MADTATTYMSYLSYMSYRGRAATKKEAKLKTGDWHHFPVSHLDVA